MDIDPLKLENLQTSNELLKLENRNYKAKIEALQKENQKYKNSLEEYHFLPYNVSYRPLFLLIWLFSLLFTAVMVNEFFDNLMVDTFVESIPAFLFAFPLFFIMLWVGNIVLIIEPYLAIKYRDIDNKKMGNEFQHSVNIALVITFIITIILMVCYIALIL